MKKLTILFTLLTVACIAQARHPYGYAYGLKTDEPGQGYKWGHHKDKWEKQSPHGRGWGFGHMTDEEILAAINEDVDIDVDDDVDTNDDVTIDDDETEMDINLYGTDRARANLESRLSRPAGRFGAETALSSPGLNIEDEEEMEAINE